LLLALVVVELGLLAALLAVLAARAGGTDEFVARDTLLAEADLPAGWVPVEAAAYPYMTGSPLLSLMLEEETVAGAFSAYRDPEDSSAIATYVVFRPNKPLVLRAGGDDDRTLEKMTPLVAELERLARQRLGGAVPELFFASTDVPVPGALRGRSLAPPYGEGVQSETILFTAGSVLALVVIEHPQGQEPFRPVEELAQVVYSRIQGQLDQLSPSN
jgi:hypothetical protein